MIQSLKWIATITALLLLSACSLFSPVDNPAKKSYLIAYSHNGYVKKQSSGQSILVSPPSSVSWLNTTQMAYQSKPYQIDYFALHQWAATPSDMLHSVIVQSFQASGKFKA